MYQPIRQQFYDFITGLIGLITTAHMWWIVGPFTIMGVIIWFIRWSVSVSKGERMDNLGLDVEDSIVQTQTMMSSGYAELRRQGFDTRQIAHLRRQRAGNQIYSTQSQSGMSRRRLRIK